jgi:hypothetical protein
VFAFWTRKSFLVDPAILVGIAGLANLVYDPSEIPRSSNRAALALLATLTVFLSCWFVSCSRDQPRSWFNRILRPIALVMLFGNLAQPERLFQDPVYARVVLRTSSLLCLAAIMLLSIQDILSEEVTTFRVWHIFLLYVSMMCFFLQFFVYLGLF